MIKQTFLALLFTLSTMGGAAMATEEPPYTATLQDGAFEVREYPALIAAEVSVTGERRIQIAGRLYLWRQYPPAEHCHDCTGRAGAVGG
jgi:hypothetical protein